MSFFFFKLFFVDKELQAVYFRSLLLNIGIKQALAFNTTINEQKKHDNLFKNINLYLKNYFTVLKLNSLSFKSRLWCFLFQQNYLNPIYWNLYLFWPSYLGNLLNLSIKPPLGWICWFEGKIIFIYWYPLLMSRPIRVDRFPQSS